MPLVILRIVFLVTVAGIAVWTIRSEQLDLNHPFWVFSAVMALATGVVAADFLVPRKQLETISAVYFGLIVGLFLAYVAGLALTPLPLEPATRDAVQLLLGAVLCYMCISLLIQTKNDFRFIIPYVEFSKEVKGLKPFVLDTSVIIDGRIADVVDAKILDNQLVIPRFVLNELQAVADSSDRLRRSRGRRGLDILNRLRSNSEVDLQIYEHELAEFSGQPVDVKLVMLAKHLHGKIVTNDYNLNKVSRLHGVGVLNLNDLANALKPVFLPGESMEVRLVKPGEESGQGVGYLDDGTMVVVEAGREHVGKSVKITVTSVLQTSAGRMVFGRYDGAAATPTAVAAATPASTAAN